MGTGVYLRRSCLALFKVAYLERLRAELSTERHFQATRAYPAAHPHLEIL